MPRLGPGISCHCLCPTTTINKMWQRERERGGRREEAVGRNGNRRGDTEERKRGRRDYEFKWPSQDNSKNAFKRKSVKEFRLWATDCVERGIDCRQGAGRVRTGERQRLRQRNLSQRQTPKTKNSLCAGQERRAGNGKCDCRQRQRQRERDI